MNLSLAHFSVIDGFYQTATILTIILLNNSKVHFQKVPCLYNSYPANIISVNNGENVFA